jgi:hypothetical protein
MLCPDCGGREYRNHRCPVRASRERTRKPRVSTRVPQRELEIVMLYTGGCDMQEIAKGIGLSRERVRQILSWHGVTGKSHKGWRTESLSDPDTRLGRRRTGRDAEGRRTETMMRRGWRERVLARVIAELAEDLGRAPINAEIARALGMSLTWTTPSAAGGFLSAWLCRKPGESFAALTDRAYARAGVAKPGRGERSHTDYLESKASAA